MAKPQLEDGHTRLANEILEHLMKMRLSPNQWQVLLCIIRKTYGFQKKVDYIANFQLVEATGLCKAVISRTLHSLTNRNIITRNGKHIGFQKDWERWQKLAEQSTFPELAVQSTELAEQSTKVSSCAVTQKKKETIQKKEIYKNNNINDLISGQSIEKIKRILKGDYPEGKDVPERTKQVWRHELKRRGIEIVDEVHTEI